MNLVDKILSHKKRAGTQAHRIVDTALAWGLGNAAVIYGSLEGAEWIKEHATAPERITDPVAYVAAGAAITAANVLPFGIRKLSGDAWNFWSRRLNYNNHADKAHHIGSLATATLLGILATGPLKDQISYHWDEFLQPQDTRLEISAPLVPELEVMTDDQGNLDGRHFSSWFANYVGVKQNDDELRNQNHFGNSINRLWKKKLAKSNDAKERKIYEEQVLPYIDAYDEGRIQGMTLNGFYNTIDDTLNTVKTGTNFELLAEGIGIPEERRQLFEQIGRGIGADELLAQTLNELMGPNGEQNKETADYIVRNAGAEYFWLMPGSATTHAEFGSQQNTKFIVQQINRTYENGFKLQDAFGVELPKDISTVKNQTHEILAYAAAVQTVGEIMSNLSPEEYLVFKERVMNDYSNIPMIMGVAHHSPADAKASVERWVNSEDEEFIPAIKNHRPERTKALRTYAKNVRNNYLAINTFESEEGRKYGPYVQTPFSTGNVLEIQYMPSQNMSAEAAAQDFNTFDDKLNHGELPDLSARNFATQELEAGKPYKFQLRWE